VSPSSSPFIRRARRAGSSAKRWAAAALAILTVVASVADARAEDPDAAGALIAEGLSLREQGRDAEALERFERAQAIAASPRVTAQIALAHQALGHWLAAERGLLAALASGDDPWIRSRRPSLEQALETVHAQLAWLEVEDNVAEGQVWIDGRKAADLPLSEPLRVLAGSVVLEVRAPGYEPLARRIAIRAGEHARESLVLAPQVAHAPKPAAAHPSTTPSAARTAAWATLGGAVALLAGGAAAHVVREVFAARWNDDSQCLPANGGTRESACASDAATAKTATALAIAGYAAGGATALVSGYLFLERPTAGRPSAAARAWLTACTVGPLAVSCGGTF
jgi:tetratricopeptide (TPR) repeat protein